MSTMSQTMVKECKATSVELNNVWSKSERQMETRDLNTACVIIVSRWLREHYMFVFRLLDISVFTSGHSMLFQLVLWVLSGHRERKQYSYNNSSTVWFEIVFYSQEVQGFQEDLWVRANHEVPGNTQTHTRKPKSVSNHSHDWQSQTVLQFELYNKS